MTAIASPRDRVAPKVAPPETPTPAPRRAISVDWAIVAAVALGVVVRAVLVFTRDFPLNDGGLFYLMAEEVQRAHYRLPAFTAYNAMNIPFAYSPLGFYAAAALADVTGLGMVQVFRILPLVATAGTVAAFALLARAMLAPIASRGALLTAVVAFSLVPRSYIWMIMGGGLTRSFGFLFAILTLHQAYRLYTTRESRYVLPMTLGVSLTVLSHLGTSPFLAFSIALLWLAYGRHRHGVLSSVVVVVGALALTAPWWATVMAQHGIEPFLAARQTGGSVFADAGTRNFVLMTLARFGLGTGEPLFPIVGVLAILGVLASLTPRRFLIPVWWLTIVLLEARAGATYATIPVAMLAGIGFTEVILPVLARPWGTVARARHGTRFEVAAVGPQRTWIPAVVSALFLAYGVSCALLRRPELGTEGRWLNSLSRGDRQAMEWVAKETPSGSRFLVVTGGVWGGWWADRVGEWFPVLAERVSVATVQGSEWLPKGEFGRRWGLYDRAQGCGGWFAVCLTDWEREANASFTHVYIPKAEPFQCCNVLLHSLRADTSYATVYDGDGATIFVRRHPPTGGPVPAE